MTTTSGAARRIAVIVALATLLGALAAGAYIDPNQSPIAQNPDSGGTGSSGSGGSTSGGGAGAPMPADDGGGRTRPYSLALDYSRLVFQPVVFDGSFSAVVCTSAAPAPTATPVQQTPEPLGALPAQPCTSSSQCGPGNACYAGRCWAA